MPKIGIAKPKKPDGHPVVEAWIEQHRVEGTPCNLKISYDDSHEVVGGYRYRELAMYQYQGKGEWIATHPATGWALNGRGTLKEDVERYLFSIRKICDWEFAHYGSFPKTAKPFCHAMRDYCLGNPTKAQIKLLVRGITKVGLVKDVPEEVELGEELEMGQL